MIKYCIPFLLFATHAAAYTDLTTAKAIIVTTLHRYNPTALDAFKKFFNQYDRSVYMFFDRNNNDSLQTHLQRMYGELRELEVVMADAQFQSVRPLLQEQHDQLVNLLAVLQRYIGSDQALSLAFKVKKFKFLLPPDVKKRGNISLYKSLRHRLAQ